MRATAFHLAIPALLFVGFIHANGQTPAASINDAAAGTSLSMDAPANGNNLPIPLQVAGSSAVQQLLAFKGSDVKFPLRSLMDVLRDRRHEGWILAAYPDPKTHRPLIGAGFSLDLPARDHPQRDPLNPHLFLEPSSAELWQAAGLDSERLDKILVQYHEHVGTWTRRNRRVKLSSLAPQITSEDATQLLRIAAVQSIHNARAYCRNFDQLSASQQMALSQLVYQMGVNLEQFTQFLGLINSSFPNTVPDSSGDAHLVKVAMQAKPDSLDWKEVQLSLVQSQWARLYRMRALSVIAMLDPQYPDNPALAERRIGSSLRPAVVVRRRGHPLPSRQLASVNHRQNIGRRSHSTTVRKKHRV